MGWRRVVLVVGLLAGTTAACGSGSSGVASKTSGTAREANSCDGGLVLVAPKSADEEGGDLVGLTADGRVRQLTNDGGSYGGALSPDGKQVVFASVGEGGEVSDSFGPAGLDLYVIGADGTGRRKLLDSALEEAEPDWSPDGKRIAYVERSGEDGPRQPARIHVVDADGSGARELVPGDSSSDDVDPAWSSEGKQVAFLRRTPDRSTTQVMVADADGSGARVVHETSDQLGRPTWSPEGKRLAFPALAVGDGTGATVPALAVLHLADGSITDGPAGIDGVAWAATGRLYGLAKPPAVVDRSGNWRVAELEAGGRVGFRTGRAISAIKTVYFLYTDYGVDTAACLGDRSVAFTSDADVPESITVTDPASGKDASVLTRSEAIEHAQSQYLAKFDRSTVKTKLVSIGAVDRGQIFVNPGEPHALLWFVIVRKAGIFVFDAETGAFISGGGSIVVPDVPDLAP